MLQHEALSLLHSIGVIAVPTLALSFVVSGLFVVAGWGRRREVLRRHAPGRMTDRFELGQTPFAGGVLSVVGEARAILRECEGLAPANWPNWTVRSNQTWPCALTPGRSGKSSATSW